ncbi:MAG: MBL fold metallo-hydrolase, partial [Abditibacteriales bacterium]|nr:MBL fold metallo-hydrolase [Abditibacteriales bacterium]MDW8367611.1 MBL fold metallo-hydrolase [Abditibacteriales bacterium]
EIDLLVVSGGRFRVDGGGMFGVVPKVLWARHFPADERNRILMETNCLLIRTAGRTILVDTGCGTKMMPKEREIWGLEGEDIVAALSARGVKAEEVDTVVLTHLHVDHVGGALILVDGKPQPAFPNARYLVQRGEFEDAQRELSLLRRDYSLEDFLPLQAAGVLDLLDGDTEVAPGVRTWVTGGHTRAHQALLLESMGEKAIYFADLIPTTAHLKPAWNMAFDVFPLETMQRKLQILPRVVEENWLCFFDHDPNVPMGRLRRREDGGVELCD